MLQEEMIKSLNQQMNREFESAWLYLSMAGWSENQNYPGSAHWLKIQAEEECGHGMRFFQYLIDQEAPVELEALRQPARNWESMTAVFENALKHEQLVTGWINEIMMMAVNSKDNATRIFLDYFVMEQIEEEHQTDDIRRKLKLFEQNPAAVYMLDLELGKRKHEDH